MAKNKAIKELVDQLNWNNSYICQFTNQALAKTIVEKNSDIYPSDKAEINIKNLIKSIHKLKLKNSKLLSKYSEYDA